MNENNIHVPQYNLSLGNESVVSPQGDTGLKCSRLSREEAFHNLESVKEKLL